MKRSEILEAARRCVCGEREQDYGTPENNFETIGLLWGVYLRAAHPEYAKVMPCLLYTSIAQKAFSGLGEFVPGDHCRFCRGKAQCRARANTNTEKAFCAMGLTFSPQAISSSTVIVSVV